MMVKKKKTAKKAAKKRTTKKKAVKKTKTKNEKVLATVEHFFGKILVAAFKLKAPLKVGDFIHIKGHTTDFVQRIDSMQIDHKSVLKGKKGQDIGIRVKSKVRQGDTVFLSAKQTGVTAQPVVPMFPAMTPSKPKVQPRPTPPPPKKSGYSGTKFLNF